MIAFLAGAVFELSYLAWIYAAAQGWPVTTAILSMLVGLVSLTGIREGLQTKSGKWFLVLGYGVGSYLAAWLRCYT